MTSYDHANIRLVEAVLSGITGDTAYERAQKRAEWMHASLPKTAALMGIEWDERKRLTYRTMSDSNGKDAKKGTDDAGDDVKPTDKDRN